MTDIVGDLTSSVFGAPAAESSSAGTSDTTSSLTQSSQTILDDEAIQQLIADVLGGADGLASIFAGEQVAGIFDSSVAAQAAGDLASKLVGELAKLTAETVTSQETDTRARTTGSGTQTDPVGLLDVGNTLASFIPG